MIGAFFTIMIDLHVHSTASDGTDTPAGNVLKAKKIGLTAIAICDHDSVEGVDEALDVGREQGVEVIPAVEMSSKVNDWDTHFLGYFIDHHNVALKDTVQRLREARRERAISIVERLNNLGVPLTFDDVRKEAAEGALGRAHIARALAYKGLVVGIPQAFSKYLSRGRPAYVEKFVLTPHQIIELIHHTGGVAALAHPALSRANDHMDQFIGYGLDAIEVYHTEHSERQRDYYKNLAGSKGLLITGGSDCHGSNSSHGATIGTIDVPDSVLEALRQRANARRRGAEGSE
ncbi:MAG: PHP domain-containing protein [Candidatus Aquicultorales bacterium]